jgi:hypothetical protein
MLICNAQVSDTPAEQDANQADNVEGFWGTKRHEVVAQICKPLNAGTITREKADQLLVEMGVDSCKAATGQDNIFNFMSYSPDECQRELTPGQVKYMQAAIMNYRPLLYKNSQA